MSSQSLMSFHFYIFYVPFNNFFNKILNWSLVPSFWFVCKPRSSSCRFAWEEQKISAAVLLASACLITWFPPLFILCFMLCTLYLFLPQNWIVQRTTSNHNRPGWAELQTPPLPQSSNLAGCIHRHSAIVTFSGNLFCCSGNITPPPLGPDRRPRGSPRGSVKPCLAMPQVRRTTEQHYHQRLTGFLLHRSSLEKYLYEKHNFVKYEL